VADDKKLTMFTSAVDQAVLLYKSSNETIKERIAVPKNTNLDPLQQHFKSRRIKLR
jgi:hypothetical protein|tara:strand:- start:853 stop:1020 length:168 start_codon:yes stop_codon:yes gene_type:complete